MLRKLIQDKIYYMSLKPMPSNIRKHGNKHTVTITPGGISLWYFCNVTDLKKKYVCTDRLKYIT